MSPPPSFRGPLSCLALLVLEVGLLGYLGYLAGRPDLGVMRESVTLSRSRADGLYVGDYTPDQSSLTLPDGTRVEFSTAWPSTPGSRVWRGCSSTAKRLSPATTFACR